MCTTASTVCLCACVTLCGTVVAAEPAPGVVVADFDGSCRSAQGGMYHCAGGTPEQVSDRLLTAGEPASSAWRINVSADAPATGVGGIVPLFDNGTRGKESPLLDVSSLAYVYVRLIGDLGDRSLSVQAVPGTVIVPERWGAELGRIQAADLDPLRWRTQTLSILAEGLDRTKLGAIRLMLEGTGPAWVAVDSITFSDNPDSPVVGTDKPVAPRKLRRPMWVWHTARILPDPAQIEQLLEFCQQHGITELFCQVPYDYVDGQIELHLVPEQRAFNAAARQAGVMTHALDGAPDFVFRANHPRLFKLVEALDRFNREGPAEGRYRAVPHG